MKFTGFQLLLKEIGPLMERFVKMKVSIPADKMFDFLDGVDALAEALQQTQKAHALIIREHAGEPDEQGMVHVLPEKIADFRVKEAEIFRAEREVPVVGIPVRGLPADHGLTISELALLRGVGLLVKE